LRTARKQNTRLALRGVQGQMRYFLEISRFDHLFEIEEPETAS
jgi:anti-anti-sigma regulatory factor